MGRGIGGVCSEHHNRVVGLGPIQAQKVLVPAPAHRRCFRQLVHVAPPIYLHPLVGGHGCLPTLALIQSRLPAG